MVVELPGPIFFGTKIHPKMFSRYPHPNLKLLYACKTFFFELVEKFFEGLVVKLKILDNQMAVVQQTIGLAS